MDQILTIHSHILFEHSIYLVSLDPALLKNVVNSLLSLMYPFVWQHTCIAIVSDGLKIETPAIVGYRDIPTMESIENVKVSDMELHFYKPVLETDSNR